MIRIRGVVEFHGGERAEFVAGTAARAEWELYAHRHGLPVDGSPILAALVIACYVLHGSLEGFEGWRANVLDVELEAVDVEAVAAVPPTLREVSDA